ncbi:bifunctional UDP-sugar hydrolase/5'-nucleotidase UshA [Curvibacter sp. APW13]|uniref:bifunctional UDP-sugar hydrolase/5'-nucleotidase UshA n=1 Tax=Curvibacter sp. APW13 TaxID=3077236 RepID=UPI0028DFE703|nr:bifunctional UDP-sugar hydrolase/5'-nucleotidase UshA [Curvibacter sp. APW13]MDT8990006.1 bifunctional UDP-sugar hydrolase/5'-nucleotidase UshA [Curvibacter sp. APW13]
MLNRRLVLLHLGTALLLAGCASFQAAPPPPPAGTVKLTVLHTNDHHGRFWKNGDGEYGMAARKTLIDHVRREVAAQGGYTLLLDGGDINTGVPESDTQDAEPDFKGMKAIGYDAMAVGNHEFDKPLPVLRKQIAWAGFPVLSANIYKGGQRLFTPYTVLERGGLKIAVLGLTTDDTKKMVDPANVEGVEFRRPAAEAAALLPELKGQAHLVFAATHMGHYPDGQRGVNAPGDVEMAREVKGLDLIVGGHSQNPVCMLEQMGAAKRNEAYVPGTPCQPDRQNGTWIVQAHEWGKYVGRADFEYTGGELKLVKYALLPVNLMKTVKGADGKDTKQPYTERIAEDPAMLALLQPYQDKGRAALDAVVGESDGVLNGKREDVRSKPTNMGVFIATVMMHKAKADLAIMNSGGVRDSMPAGKLTYKDVLKVQPFGNMVSVVELKGSELTTYLEAAMKMSPGSGAFPQFAGVRIVAEGGKLVSASVRGAPIDPTRTYRLALNNFQANGGDGYPKLSTHPGYVNTGFVDADVMREYLSKNKVRVADFEPGDAVVRR